MGNVEVMKIPNYVRRVVSQNGSSSDSAGDKWLMHRANNIWDPTFADESHDSPRAIINARGENPELSADLLQEQIITAWSPMNLLKASIIDPFEALGQKIGLFSRNVGFVVVKGPGVPSEQPKASQRTTIFKRRDNFAKETTAQKQRLAKRVA